MEEDRVTLSRAARHLGGRAVTCRSSFSISNVGLDDEGTYKCILDFKTDPSINEEFTTVVVRIKARAY